MAEAPHPTGHASMPVAYVCPVGLPLPSTQAQQCGLGQVIDMVQPTTTEGISINNFSLDDMESLMTGQDKQTSQPGASAGAIAGVKGLVTAFKRNKGTHYACVVLLSAAIKGHDDKDAHHIHVSMKARDAYNAGAKWAVLCIGHGFLVALPPRSNRKDAIAMVRHGGDNANAGTAAAKAAVRKGTPVRMKWCRRCVTAHTPPVNSEDVDAA